MVEIVCSRPQFRVEPPSGRLPTIQADRHPRVAGDSTILVHGHRSMSNYLRIVHTTLKPEPFATAATAPQWWFGYRRSSPPIIKGDNSIHERR